MAMVQGSLSKAAFMRFRVLIAIVALISSPIEGYISPHISTVRVRSHHQVCDPFYPKRPAISPRSVLEDQSRLLPKLRISKTAMTIGESLPILSTLTQLWQQGLAINSVLALILATRGTNRSLTSQGLLHAYALGVGLWSLIGFEAWVIGVAYFILGSVVTKIKMKEKEVRPNPWIRCLCRSYSSTILHNRDLGLLKREVEQEVLRMSGVAQRRLV